MQNQPYQEIQDIEIYQISKLKIKFRIIKLPKIEVKLVQIIQNLRFFVFFLSSMSLYLYLLFINMIFKFMHLIDLNVLNLMVCLTLHIDCNYITS